VASSSGKVLDILECRRSSSANYAQVYVGARSGIVAAICFHCDLRLTSNRSQPGAGAADIGVDCAIRHIQHTVSQRDLAS